MEQNTNKQTNEINLYNLWKIIVKRKRIVIGIVFFTVISTAIINVLMPKIYRSETTLRILLRSGGAKMVLSKEPLVFVSSKELIDMVGIIDKEKKKIILPTTYASVTNIKLIPAKESKNQIIVTIEASNVGDMPRALLELVDYLNNVDLLKNELKEEKEIISKRSSELGNIIESTSNLYSYLKLMKETKVAPIFVFNPVDIDIQIADIKIEKLLLEQSLLKHKNGFVEIAMQQYISKNPVRPKRKQNVILAVIVSLFVGVITVIILDYVEKIKEVNKVPRENV